MVRAAQQAAVSALVVVSEQAAEFPSVLALSERCEAGGEAGSSSRSPPSRVLEPFLLYPGAPPPRPMVADGDSLPSWSGQRFLLALNLLSVQSLMVLMRVPCLDSKGLFYRAWEFTRFKRFHQRSSAALL